MTKHGADDDSVVMHPVFLGGGSIGQTRWRPLPELEHSKLRAFKKALTFDATVSFAMRRWSFIVIAPPHSYKPDLFLTIFGALMIIVASACAAQWIFSRSKARSEKAAILLESAKKAAQGERELNDFIAHE
jgi:hypothetical protein